MPLKLAPGITLYRFGSPAPPLQPGSAGGLLALPQLPRNVTGATVFGDGSHPTTRLCAGALDFLCRQRHPTAVLDVGTGTGVLARIARARGAQFIVGTDIDPLALRCAEAHAALDTHPVAIQFSREAPDNWGKRFDLIVANILEQPLRNLAVQLSRALLPEGLLLLSGFTRPQTPALRVIYTTAGVAFVRESHLDEWSLLMFQNPEPRRPR
ncbi:MAG: 50S ribosomal protein L11 methyltransferase [Steroidobacteraceae bacterium]